jgi:Cu/Ag efflux protein CusF
MKRPAHESSWKICYGRGIVKATSLISPTLIVAAALTLAGCSSAPPAESKTAAPATATPAPPAGATGGSGQAAAIKRYPMHGKILSLDATEKSARIDAGPIGDWMGAMTMNYTIKDPAEFTKLTVGETFDATVFVDGDNFWVGEVKPAPAK